MPFLLQFFHNCLEWCLKKKISVYSSKVSVSVIPPIISKQISPGIQFEKLSGILSMDSFDYFSDNNILTIYLEIPQNFFKSPEDLSEIFVGDQEI